MLKIKFRKIDFDPVTFQIDLKKMKKALNRKTILVIIIIIIFFFFQF